MKNNKGFSLVELMVVVAIIAILASFAVPQYESFQAKARQKEALSLMNAFYAASKAVEGEYGWFPGNFEATGFNPAGQLHYRVTAEDGTNPPSGPNNDSCVNTGATCTNNFADWTEVTTGSFAAGAVNNCTVDTDSTNGTYLTCFSAAIRNNAGNDRDTWSLTHAKAMTNTNDGIN